MNEFAYFHKRVHGKFMEDTFRYALFEVCICITRIFFLFVCTDNLHQNCGCTLLLVKSSRWVQDLWLLVMLLRKIDHLLELHILVPVNETKKYINTFLISEYVQNFYYPNFLLR